MSNVGPAIDPEKLSKFEVFGGLRLSTVIHRNDWKALSGGDYNVLPLVYQESPFSADQVKNFDAYEVFQIMGDMPESTAFRVLFERCFPISDIFASRTIYIMESFIESLTPRVLGLTKELAFVPLYTEFLFWDGRMFDTSRKYIKTTMQQYYYGRDSSYVEETFENHTPSAKAANAIGSSLLNASVRELGLSRKEMGKMFIIPAGYKLPSSGT
jgi:hypothetical protein